MTTRGPFIETRISPWRDVFRAGWWTSALVYVVLVLILDVGGAAARITSIVLLVASIASVAELIFYRDSDRPPSDGS